MAADIKRTKQTHAGRPEPERSTSLVISWGRPDAKAILCTAYTEHNLHFYLSEIMYTHLNWVIRTETKNRGGGTLLLLCCSHKRQQTRTMCHRDAISRTYYRVRDIRVSTTPALCEHATTCPTRTTQGVQCRNPDALIR